MQVVTGQLPLLIELLDGAAPYLTACLVELICNCGELLAAKKVRPENLVYCCTTQIFKIVHTYW